MRSYYFLLILLCSTGCVTMDKYPGVHTPYAPENESHAGQVSYRAGTSSVATALRREEAYKQMYNACGGHYTIISETEERNNVVGIINNGMIFGGRIGRHYIQYECSNATTFNPNAPPPPIVNP